MVFYCIEKEKNRCRVGNGIIGNQAAHNCIKCTKPIHAISGNQPSDELLQKYVAGNDPKERRLCTTCLADEKQCERNKGMEQTMNSKAGVLPSALSVVHVECNTQSSQRSTSNRLDRTVVRKLEGPSVFFISALLPENATSFWYQNEPPLLHMIPIGSEHFSGSALSSNALTNKAQELYQPFSTELSCNLSDSSTPSLEKIGRN
eukprot:gb/GEZJ01003530.1/.p1 GENE.gb/GEZJ01003530.1/~~gb/GEZJ01003530.1/.p1  ORF type:complete len:204 (-),score=31.43 gb/GEZJ01003530.1/:776-1387(-)